MKRWMRTTLIILGGVGLLAAAGCEKKPAPAGSSAVSSGPAGSTSAPAEKEPDKLTKSDARRLIAEGVGDDAYMILDGNTALEVEGTDYYVFIVARRADNKAVGQVAVSAETGEKFNYEGENVLGDYAEFERGLTAAEEAYSWDGDFTDGARILSLVPMDSTSFEYTIGEQTGTARIAGSTAQDEANGVQFAFDKADKLILSGAVTGTFSPPDAAERTPEA